MNDDVTRKTTALVAMAMNFGAEMPETLLTMWLGLLSGYTAEQVEAGVLAVISKHVYKGLPAFAVLKRELDGGSADDRIALEGAKAWQELLAEVSRVGVYRRPNLPPATAEAVRLLGGWEAVCGWRETELQFRRNDFLGHYAQLAKSDPSLLTTSAPGSRMAALRARMAGERPALGAPDDRGGRGPVQVQEGLQ